MRKFFVRTVSRVANHIRLASSPKHLSNVHRSRRVISALSKFDGEHLEPRALAYLRKVDPLVFEDVVLSMLEADGCFVLRNRRYTGDGGLDGRFWWPGGGRWAVQCKRYTGHVDPRDVEQFARLVRDSFAGGIFVHTGRTGNMSYRLISGSNVLLLSGFDLVHAMTGRQGMLNLLAKKLGRHRY